MNKMIAYKVHLSFFDIGLGLTPEAAWMDLDKQIKPITIAAMIRFIYSPFSLQVFSLFSVFHEFCLSLFISGCDDYTAGFVGNSPDSASYKLSSSPLVKRYLSNKSRSADRLASSSYVYSSILFFLFVFHNANYNKNLCCRKL